MCKKFNYLSIVLAFVAISFLTNSCHDSQTIPVPSIISLSPANGIAGIEVIITGENFGNNSSNVEVTFGAVSAPITKFSSTELEVKAPSGFNHVTTYVAVNVNGKASNMKPFVYDDLSPVITSIAPDSVKPGTIITLTGSGFGTDKSKVKVWFNTAEATNIVSVADSQIKVEVPEGFSDEVVSVKVTVSDLVSNGIDFYYSDTSPPSITSTTSSCFYHSKVTIQGNNFSTNPEDNIVKFGTKEAIVTEATKTSLTVITPDLGSATSVDITVTKYDMVSNAKSISVDSDKNKVATYNWTMTTIRPGVIYKTGQFTLFGNTLRRIYVLDVTLNSTNTLGIGFSTTDKATVTMCKDYDAVCGTNGGYFKMAGTSDKNPYIRINGTTVQEGDLNVSTYFTDAALTIHNNVAKVRKLGSSGRNLNLVAAAIPVSEAENVIVGGPMLVSSGTIENIDMSKSHNYSQTARTGFGVTEDGKHIFMVVVDTGNNGSVTVTGVSTLQLAEILQALGAENAMNFDGGGSSTMFVDGEGGNGRVNFPYGGTYQRPVASVIYIK